MAGIRGSGDFSPRVSKKSSDSPLQELQTKLIQTDGKSKDQKLDNCIDLLENESTTWANKDLFNPEASTTTGSRPDFLPTFINEVRIAAGDMPKDLALPMLGKLARLCLNEVAPTNGQKNEGKKPNNAENLESITNF